MQLMVVSHRVVDAQVVQEPVAKWQGGGNGGPNLLQMFYQDPPRYAYTFQNYVFMTRVMQVRSWLGQHTWTMAPLSLRCSINKCPERHCVSLC